MERDHSGGVDVEALLTGSLVRVWPFTRGLYNHMTLPRLWEALREAGAIGQVFWRHQHPDQMTLHDFLTAMHAVLLLLVQTHGGEIAGCCWYEEVESFRASLSVWYRRRYWGPVAREGTALVIRYGFTLFDWRHIWAATPWRLAVRHGEALGGQVVATLPGYSLRGDVYVLKIERGQLTWPLASQKPPFWAAHH